MYNLTSYFICFPIICPYVRGTKKMFSLKKQTSGIIVINQHVGTDCVKANQLSGAEGCL